MSQQIENEVVSLEFDNKRFEKNIEQSTKSLTKFKKNLRFDEEIESEGELEKSLTKLGNKLSTMEMITFSIVNRITNKVLDLGIKIAKSLSVDQIAAGWDKYGQKVQATQTIMANLNAEVETTSESFSELGMTAEDFIKAMTDDKQKYEYVKGYLDKLNWSADETSYSLESMTSALSKFTGQGIDLERASSAVQGITYWAASAGVNARTAALATTQLTQALGRNMNGMDWMSLTNYGMDTAQFKNLVLETAAEVGTLTKDVNTGTFYLSKNAQAANQTSAAYNAFTASLGMANQQVQNANSGIEVNISNLKDMLAQGVITPEVLTKVLEAYAKFGDEMYETFEGLYEMGFDDQYATKWRSYIEELYQANLNGENYDYTSFLQMVGLNPDDPDEDVNKINLAIAALQNLASEENKFSREAFYNAQEAKSFSEAIEATKTAVSQQWAGIFEAIFGDYNQAKTFFTGVSESLIDIFAGPLYDLKDGFKAWNEEQGGFEDTKAIFEGLIDVIGSLVGAPYQALVELFGDENGSVFTPERIKRISSALRKFVETLQPIGNLIGTTLKVGIKFLLSGLKLILPILKTISAILTPVIEVIGNAISFIADTLAVVIDMIGALWVGGIDKAADFAEQLGLTEDQLEAIANAVESVKTWWDNLSSAVKEWWDEFSASEAFQNIKSILGTVLGLIVGGINRLFSWLNSINFGEKFSKGFTTVTGWIKEFFDNFQNNRFVLIIEGLVGALGQLVERILGLGNTQTSQKSGFLGFIENVGNLVYSIIAKIKDFIDNLFVDDTGKPLTLFEGIQYFFQKVVDWVKGIFKNITEADIDAITKLIWAISGLIFTISFVIATAKGAFPDMFTITSLQRFATAMDDFSVALIQKYKAEKWRAIAFLVLSFGGFALMIAGAIKMVQSAMEGENFYIAVAVIVGFIALVGLILIALEALASKITSTKTTKLTGLFKGSSTVKTGGTLAGILSALIGVSLFIWAFSSAIKRLSDLDDNQIDKAWEITKMISMVISVLGIMMLLSSWMKDGAGVSKVVKRVGGLFVKIAIAFAIFTGGLYLMANVVTHFAEEQAKDPIGFARALENIEHMLIYIALFMVGVGIAANLMSQGDFWTYVGFIVAFAGMMYVVCMAIERLKEIKISTMMDNEEMIVFAAVIGGFFALIGIVCGILSAVSNKITKNGRKSLAVMSLFIIALTGAMIGIMFGFSLLKGLDWITITVGAAAALFTIGTITALMALFLVYMKGKQITPMLKKLGLFAIIAATFAATIIGVMFAFSLLTGVEWQSILAATFGAGALIVAFAGALALFLAYMKGKKMTDVLKKIGTFAILSAVFVATVLGLMASLILIKDVPWQNILSAIAFVSVTMLAMTGVFALLSLLTKGSGWWKAALMMGVIVIAILGLALAIKVLAEALSIPVDKNSVNAVVSILTVVGIVFGVLAALASIPVVGKFVMIGVLVIAAAFVILSLAIIGIGVAFKLFGEGSLLFAKGVETIAKAANSISVGGLARLQKLFDIIGSAIGKILIISAVFMLLPTALIAFAATSLVIVGAIKILASSLTKLLDVFDRLKKYSDKDFKKISDNFKTFGDTLESLVDSLNDILVGALPKLFATLAAAILAGINGLLEGLTSNGMITSITDKLTKLLYGIFLGLPSIKDFIGMWKSKKDINNIQKVGSTAFQAFIDFTKEGLTGTGEKRKEYIYGVGNVDVNRDGIDYILSKVREKDPIKSAELSNKWKDKIYNSGDLTFERMLEVYKEIAYEAADFIGGAYGRDIKADADKYVKEFYESNNEFVIEYINGLNKIVVPAGSGKYKWKIVEDDTQTNVLDSFLESFNGIDIESAIPDDFLDKIIDKFTDGIEEKFPGLKSLDEEPDVEIPGNKGARVTDDGVVVPVSMRTPGIYSGNGFSLLSTNDYASGAYRSLNGSGSYGATSYGGNATTENNQQYIINIYGEDVDAIADKVSEIIAGEVEQGKERIGLKTEFM